MPTFTNNTFSSFYKRIFQISQTTNTGADSTIRAVETGDGVATVISLSDDVLSVQPVNDDTTGTMLVKNNAGNNIFAVDTNNSKLLGGASQTALNTQYATFSINYIDGSGMIADRHYGIPFGSTAIATTINLGSSTSSSFNDTNPASSYTHSAFAMNSVLTYWYVPDNITIDAVHWFHGADADAGDDTATHLMAYTVDTGNGSTGGDLSGGVVVADGANITNAGQEQIYYQSMTIQSADVDAGKVVLFTFAADTINSDYSIIATVKYHIR